MALGKRLKFARELRGLTLEELAVAAGMPPEGRATIQIIESRDSARTKYAGPLAKALWVRLAWLQDGDEPMEPGLMEPPGMVAAAGKVAATGSGPGYHLDTLSPWDDGTPLDDDEVEVPLFREVELAAGGGMVHTVEVNGRKLRFSRATMRAAGVDPANAACATLTGNSMERLIQDGSTIGIDRGRTQVADGEIYAIDHDGMLRVKYLYRLPGGGLRLRSENSEEHQDEIYPADSAAKIKVLGWVFWWSTVRKWRGR